MGMTIEEKLQKAHQMFDNRNLLTELKWQREYFKRGYVSNQEELFNLWIFDKCIKALEQASRKGHWIEYSWNNNGLARWGLECDKCHKKYKYGGEIWNNPNFCPNCGAKMESEEE